MSHLKERKEKTCLNCGTNPLYGRYCHVCGQENLEPKETVWHLIDHFFKDVTHFDGKFFSTVKYLLKKPGFLSTEYMIGRRASYLNPIRMYVFTSAIFFIIFFFLRSPERLNLQLDQGGQEKQINLDSLDTEKAPENGINVNIKNYSSWHPEDFKSVKAYDSVQTHKPDSLRDGWFKKIMMRRLIAAGEKYHQDSRGYSERLFENFLHSFPKIMFFSLPFFALILRLLYLRRKQYLYVDHGIFAIHLYCAIFILMLINILLGELANWAGRGWVNTLSDWAIFAIVLYMFIYLYMAMRSFYRQGKGKTFLKYVLLGLLAVLVNAILLGLFFLISAITV